MSKPRFALVALVLMFGCSSLTRADQIFTTPLGASEPNTSQPVSAIANFSLSGNTLTITLTNAQPGMTNAGQLLTDIFFTLSGNAAPSVYSQTGDLINVAGNGSVTDLGAGPLGWTFGATTVNGTSGFEWCVICQGGLSATATPGQGILGPASADGKYDNANKSIAGNGPHNPFANQTATLVLMGVPTDATADNVTFSFSTAPGDNVAAVPEPASLLLVGAGIAALAFRLRRRLPTGGI